MSVQVCTIRGWLPEQFANGAHGHWSIRARKLKVAQATTWAAAKQAGWKRVNGKARLTITLVFGNHRRRDADNLHSRVKGCVDGLKEWIVDDSIEWLDLQVRAEVVRGVKETRLELQADD
jgi:Holliday junction resolvase RusA-like endonuclease